MEAWPFRRLPNIVEATARVDFPALNSVFIAANDLIVEAWAGIRQTHVDTLLEQVNAIVPDHATSDVSWAQHLVVPPVDAEPIATAIRYAIHAGQTMALAEAKLQRADPMPEPLPSDVVATAAQVDDRATALERLLAGGLLAIVSRETVRLAGVDTDMVSAVAAVLGGEPKAGEKAALKSGSTGGVNEGRLSVLRARPARVEAAEGDEFAYLYSTELLDANTCGPCAEIDGTLYANIEEAENDYPGLGGGYVFCDGREACRGSLVGVYASQSPASVDGGSRIAQSIADAVVREQARAVLAARRELEDAKIAMRAALEEDSIERDDARSNRITISPPPRRKRPPPSR